MESSRWWDLPAAILLLFALLAATGRLIATDWVDHLSLVQTLAFIGVVAGLALGQSHFSPGVVIFFALAYGIFAVPWQLGLTLDVPGEFPWRDRLIILASRLVGAFGQLAQREPVQDPILFLCSMAALFWGLSVHAGHSLTRHARPWTAILPTGLALIIIHTSDPYVPRRVWYLAAYVGFSLLLLARLTFLHLRNHWRQIDARVPPLAAVDFSFIILAVTAVLVLLAWDMPAMADVLPDAREVWQQTMRPWQERMDDFFASLRRQARSIPAAGYYGENFSLGRGSELTDAHILTVQAPSEKAGARYYWRARVYDEYTDGQWSTSALSTTRRIAPTDLDLAFPELEARRTVTFAFVSAKPIATLYTAPQPRWVSRPADAVLAENPDDTVDLAALNADPPLSAGEVYVVRSSLTTASISQLRDAGTDYPQWVTDRYLQIPDSITPRTQELAQRIAGDLETPYEIVAAVTQYLRDNISYSETITPTIPNGREPLDWFLFDFRRGFCNYYASAEVILLRSLDIPARLAVGYAQGERQTGSNTYVVRQRNAHAWPEVYFPGLGWVEFEPTVSQDPIQRPLGQVGTEDEGGFRAPPGASAEERWRERLEELEALEETYPLDEPLAETQSEQGMTRLYTALVIAGALLLVFLAWRVRRRGEFLDVPIYLEAGVRRLGWQPPAFLHRWARRASLSPVERAYGEINRALARLGSPSDPANTPTERAAALTNALPQAAELTQRLLAEYHTAVYAPHRGDLYAAQQAARAIRRLSRWAKLRRLFGLESKRGNAT